MKSSKGSREIFDEKDGLIRSDILHLIIEHLTNEKLFSAVNVLEDEISLKFNELGNRRIKLMKFHKTILNGNWDHCVKLLTSLVPKNRQRSFLYQILRQQYLELIDNGEQERAYSFLMKHIKPLEDISKLQTENGTEFKELCYLLTCKSVTEADGELFREWKHFYHQRELLADRLLLILHDILKEDCCFYDLTQPAYATSPSSTKDNLVRHAIEPRSSRLVSLLKQSYAYQIQQSETTLPIPINSTSQLFTTMDPNIPLEILSLDSLKEKDIIPVSSVIDSTSSPPSPSPYQSAPLPLSAPPRVTSLNQYTGLPVVKRIVEDYHPAIYPSSVYAILSLQSSPLSSSDNLSSKMMNYLQQQIEPKLTCVALLHSLKSLSSTASHDGVVALSGLDTGEMVEWICYPHSTSSTTNKNTQDNDDQKNQIPYIQTIYSLPGLSSDDQKIYSDTFISPSSSLLMSHSGYDPSSSSSSNSNSNGVLQEQRLLTKENYFKKHKKMLVNKKIRDILINKVDETVAGTSDNFSLICLAASDGAINILKSKNRYFDETQYTSSVRECNWYEHLGRVNIHEGDAYTIAMDPLSSYIASGGFDCSVNILDLATLSVIRRYKEHQASITRVGCNRVGNLVYSASRDGSVRFWDILSATCIKTIYPHNRTTRDSDGINNIGENNQTEVTSAVLSFDDRYLLTSSRFSPSRLIDLRTGNVVTKYTMKGYSGSTNWFYQSSFCVNDQCVLGGTSLGTTSVWSTQSGQLLYTLQLPSSSTSSSTSTTTSTSTPGVSNTNTTDFLTQSYLKPVIPTYPLSPLPLLISNTTPLKAMNQYRRSEIIQCSCDRKSGLVGSLTSSSLVLWK